MADYNFKEWLTVEEAATWLADNAGKAYGAPALYRAIEKGLIQAYYWPGEKVSLGLFTYELAPDAKEELLTPWGASDWRQKGQPLPFLGPVPFSDYGDFLDDATRRPTKTTGIGRLLDQYGGIINGYVYIVGANDEALSLSSIPYHVLVRLDALETFARMTAQACVPPPRILIHDTRQLACCFLFGNHDLPSSELLAADIDQPQTSSPTGDPERTPTLKTLAFAAHLIANLADRLDESEPVASRKLGMKKAGKPVVSQIAAQLAKTAEALNYSGHGYGEKGFQAHLSRALKELGLS